MSDLISADAHLGNAPAAAARRFVADRLCSPLRWMACCDESLAEWNWAPIIPALACADMSRIVSVIFKFRAPAENASRARARCICSAASSSSSMPICFLGPGARAAGRSDRPVPFIRNRLSRFYLACRFSSANHPPQRHLRLAFWVSAVCW